MQDPTTLPLTIANIALAVAPLLGLVAALFGIVHEVVAKVKSSRAPKKRGQTADFRLRA